MHVYPVQRCVCLDAWTGDLCMCVPIAEACAPRCMYWGQAGAHIPSAEVCNLIAFLSRTAL